MGFHEMAFVARVKTVFARGEFVRRSYSTIDLSVAALARMDVSTGLNETVFTVSIEVGHVRLCIAAVVDLERS